MKHTAHIDHEHTEEEIERVTEDLKAKAQLAGSAALDATSAAYQRLQSKARNYGRTTDQAIRSNPYIALGFALCIGMLLGALANRPKIIQKS